MPKIKVIPLPELIDHHEPFLGEIIRKISSVGNVEEFDSIQRIKAKQKQNRCWQFLKSTIQIIIISAIALITLCSYFVFDPMISDGLFFIFFVIMIHNNFLFGSNSYRIAIEFGSKFFHDQCMATSIIPLYNEILSVWIEKCS